MRKQVKNEKMTFNFFAVCYKFDLAFELANACILNIEKHVSYLTDDNSFSFGCIEVSDAFFVRRIIPRETLTSLQQEIFLIVSVLFMTKKTLTYVCL